MRGQVELGNEVRDGKFRQVDVLVEGLEAAVKMN